MIQVLMSSVKNFSKIIFEKVKRKALFGFYPAK